MKLELKKFDPSIIKSDSVVVFIGKRNTGKSFCMKDILNYHRDLPVGIVISPTERANQYFEKFIPKMLIYDEYDEKITTKFLSRQINITKQKKDEMKKTGISNIDNRAFLILDDCLYDKKWPNDKNIRACFMNGRHYSIFFLITMQFALGIPPVLRGNIDYVFIFRENIVKNRERLYQHYAGMFPNFEVFSQTMDACTANYECLVIDNKTQSNKLEDQIYWYKAKDINFRMCSHELWDMQSIEEQRRDMGLCDVDDNDGDDEDFDPGVFSKQKMKIKVKKRG
jgi:hypothetical protein